MNRAVFLDRDGVINIDKSYVSRIEDFEFLPRLFEVLRYYRQRGYLLVIVTNQSGIGRGYYSSEDFEKLTRWMLDQLESEGIRIEAVFHCPHDPDEGCSCRKPAPGMLKAAIERYDIDPKRSWMIGDKASDIEAARRAGIENTILISKDCSDHKGAKFCVNAIFDTMKIIK